MKNRKHLLDGYEEWKAGTLTSEDTLKLFQRLADSAVVWSMEDGGPARTAIALEKGGKIGFPLAIEFEFVQVDETMWNGTCILRRTNDLHGKTDFHGDIDGVRQWAFDVSRAAPMARVNVVCKYLCSKCEGSDRLIMITNAPLWKLGRILLAQKLPIPERKDNDEH